MSEPSVSQRDAASTLFNLPGYCVIDAIETTGGGRRVVIVSTEPPGCPACGVISTRVHQRTRQRVRDIPIAGAVEVVWCKGRWICAEDLCARATFAESTLQVPARARSIIRLRHALVVAVVSWGPSCERDRPRPRGAVVGGPSGPDRGPAGAARRGRRCRQATGDRRAPVPLGALLPHPCWWLATVRAVDVHDRRRHHRAGPGRGRRPGQRRRRRVAGSPTGLVARAGRGRRDRPVRSVP